MYMYGVHVLGHQRTFAQDSKLLTACFSENYVHDRITCTRTTENLPSRLTSLTIYSVNLYLLIKEGRFLPRFSSVFKLPSVFSPITCSATARRWKNDSPDHCWPIARFSGLYSIRVGWLVYRTAERAIDVRKGTAQFTSTFRNPGDRFSS
jgi:hypothetical protein